MSGLHRAAWPALGAAILFGASTPFAKQLIGADFATASPFLLAGLLYLGSGLGLTLVRLVRDKGWQSPGMPRNEWPWLLGAIAFSGVLGPLLLMVGLAQHYRRHCIAVSEPGIGADRRAGVDGIP